MSHERSFLYVGGRADAGVRCFSSAWGLNGTFEETVLGSRMAEVDGPLVAVGLCLMHEMLNA